MSLWRSIKTISRPKKLYCTPSFINSLICHCFTRISQYFTEFPGKLFLFNHGQNWGGSYILAMVCDDDISFSWLCLLYLLSGKMLAGACILWSVLSMSPTDQRIHRDPIHVYVVFGHRFCCGVTNAVPTTRANFYW